MDGAPYPAECTEHVYVARRGGTYYDGRHTGLPGAILVLNNHPTEAATIWVSTGGKLYKPWQGLSLVNYFKPIGSATYVQENGRVQLTVPAQGYSVYVPIEFGDIPFRYYQSRTTRREEIKPCLKKTKDAGHKKRLKWKTLNDKVLVEELKFSIE